MSRASDARRRKRDAKRKGAVLYDSVSISRAALDTAEAKGADRVDFIAFHVANALTRLDDAGGDLEAFTVVTIGEHPEHPGDLTIEAKVSKLKPEPVIDRGDIAVPPADEADLPNSDR